MSEEIFGKVMSDGEPYRFAKAKLLLGRQPEKPMSPRSGAARWLVALEIAGRAHPNLKEVFAMPFQLIAQRDCAVPFFANAEVDHGA